MDKMDIPLQMKYQHINNVLASQRLEGLEPDPRTIDDLRQEARGQMTMDDVRARVFDRLQRGDF